MAGTGGGLPAHDERAYGGAVADSTSGMQLSFFQLDDPVLAQVRDEIIGTDIDNLTPLQALTKLNDIRRILLGK